MNPKAEISATKGDVIGGKYRVESRLAVGAMGTVFAARHIQLDEPVAIKVLHPHLVAGPRFAARFMREARNAARIKSEHVPRFIDVGRLPSGLPYLVMEHLEGSTLAQTIGREALKTSDAVDYVLQACEAVAAGHLVGILHRDLKPSNLFLMTRLDGSPLIKVLDFGVSRALNSRGEREDEGLTVADVTLGAHDFKAPEQLAGGDVDARCDVWALGAILYNLLTDHPPFVGETPQDVIKKILKGRPTPVCQSRPTVSEKLESAVMRCLKGDRDARPASVAQLALFLQDHASEQARGIPSSILKAQNRARRLSGAEVSWQSSASIVARDVDAAPLLEIVPDVAPSEAEENSFTPRPRTSPAFTRRKKTKLSRAETLAIAWLALAVAMALLLLAAGSRMRTKASSTPPPFTTPASAMASAAAPPSLPTVSPTLTPPAPAASAVEVAATTATATAEPKVTATPRVRVKPPAKSAPTATARTGNPDPWGWDR
jgi:eukaryotic-like serine/threonine-protein kinase